MKKIIKNLMSSFLAQIISVILGIIIPRLVLTSFGSEVNGLLNSTSQLFAYIALLEGGVGTATLQALYGPVSRSEHENINSILAATDCFYRKTGMIYFLCVIGLSLGYPLVVNTDIHSVTIILVIFLQGMSGVLNYFFQGKFRILLQAEGKNYVLTNLSTVIQIFVGFGKVIVISLGFDVVALQFVYFLFNVAQMLYIVIYIKKHYTWMNLKVSPNYESISQKYDVLVGQVSSLVFNNTDMLLLTLFCDLKTVSVYSVYLMLCNMINTVIDSISSSITFKFGHVYNNNKALFGKIQVVFEKYYLSVVFMFYSVMLVFLIPFLRLYTAGVNDVDYVDRFLPFAFVLMQLLSYSKRPYNQVVTLAQHFKETKWRSVAEAIINLSVSMALVYNLGIYGVLIGSIVALLYRLIDLVFYSNKKILGISMATSWMNLLLNLLRTVIVVVWGHSWVGSVDSYVELFSRAVVVTGVSGILFIGLNVFLYIKDTKWIVSIIKDYKS